MIQSSKHIESVGGFGSGSLINCSLFIHMLSHNGSEGCRGPTEDIISYFTLMSSEIHYYDIIEKMGSWTLMSSEV